MVILFKWKYSTTIKNRIIYKIGLGYLRSIIIMPLTILVLLLWECGICRVGIVNSGSEIG